MGRQRPASYFPFIEKKYGHPISHWIDLSTPTPSSPTTANSSAGSSRSTGSATATPPPWSATRWRTAPDTAPFGTGPVPDGRCRRV